AFLTDPPAPTTSPLSLHDALPISPPAHATDAKAPHSAAAQAAVGICDRRWRRVRRAEGLSSAGASVLDASVCIVERVSEGWGLRSEEHTSELQSRENLVCRLLLEK